MSEPRNAPHLLRVDAPPERFAALIAAATAEGLRIGWLDLPAVSSDPPEPLPASLEAAAVLGVLRAVAVAGNRSVTVKPVKGAPVLRDLLREHFRGCALVLVRGEITDPKTAFLRPGGEEDWTVIAPDPSAATARTFTSAALAAALRRPRPWGPPLPPRPPRPAPDPRKQGKKRRDLRLRKAREKKDKKDNKDGKDNRKKKRRED